MQAQCTTPITDIKVIVDMTEMLNFVSNYFNSGIRINALQTKNKNKNVDAVLKFELNLIDKLLYKFI